MTSADAAGQVRPGPAPETFGTDVIVLTYAGIIAAAGGSLTFNIWHAEHKQALLLALIIGFLPPFLSTVLAHVAAAARLGPRGRGCVFFLTGGMMFVSAWASSQVLKPVDGLAVGIVFSLFADAISMACLVILMKAYAAKADYKQWLQAGGRALPGIVPGTAAGTPNDSGAAVPGTAAGLARNAGPVVPGNADPVVPRNEQHPDPDPGGLVSGTPSVRPSVQPPALPGSRPARTARRPSGDSTGEDRKAAVVADIAARPRPAVESTGQREKRALDILAEFRRRTGQRMTNTDFARALGVRKQAAIAVRDAVEEPAA